MKGKLRHRKNRRPMQHIAKNLGELSIRHRIRSGEIQWPLYLRIEQREEYPTNHILNRDPAPPLPPIAKSSTAAEFESRQQFSKRTAFVAQHHADPRMHHAHARIFRALRRCFPRNTYV